MKNRIYYFLVGVFCVCFFTGFRIYAQDTSGVEETINRLKTKIAELQNQEKTLGNEILKFNSAIELSTLKIKSIRSTIDTLSKEINEMASEIERLEDVLTRRSELVLYRIPESYKRRSAPIFGIILLSANVSDFFSRMKYIQRVQEEDAQTVIQLKATQTNLSGRIDTREKKKKQQEALKAQLEQENRTLEKQKKEKESFLVQTKNDETVYQQLLAQALAERQAIESALVNSVKVGPIKKGDPVALVGNTGWNPDPNKSCSTGKHLHFEIRKNNSWVDPAGYLSSKTILDVQDVTSGVNWTVGNGSWDWPIQDTIRLTQHFGKTPYSWRYPYSGYIHTGFDMVSSSDVIRAPADGTLYSSTELCKGSTIINIKYIEHSDGIVSFYLHVQ